MTDKTDTKTTQPKRTRKTAAKPKAPAALAAKDAARIKPAPGLKADQAARVGEAAGDAAPGYIVRWPKAGHDLLLKTDAAPADAPT